MLVQNYDPYTGSLFSILVDKSGKQLFAWRAQKARVMCLVRPLTRTSVNQKRKMRDLILINNLLIQPSQFSSSSFSLQFHDKSIAQHETHFHLLISDFLHLHRSSGLLRPDEHNTNVKTCHVSEA